MEKMGRNKCSGKGLVHQLRGKAAHIKKDLLKRCLPEVHLTQALFDEGTLILSKPAYYILKEDIVFNPNPGNNFRPRTDQPQYRSFGFMIFDFFAAIVVTAKCFVIDFNGFSIGRSLAFALTQPVYAHIELTDSPFIPKEGPSNPGGFPGEIKSAEYGLIFSSNPCKPGKMTQFFPHHCIHGNGAKQIVVDNIIFEDFEVAAVANNGGEEIFYMNGNCYGPNTRQKFTTGAWHSLLRAIRFAEQVPDADRDADFNSALAAAIAFRDSQLPILLGPNPQNVDPLIANPSGIMDGNCYAIVNAPLGVAVDDFSRPGSERASSCHVLVDEPHIKGIHLDVREVIALSTVDAQGKVNGAQIGPSGDVFRICEVLQKGVPLEQAVYTGNPIANLLIELAATQQRTGRPVGTTSIQPETVRWAKFGAPFAGLGNLFPFVCNGDSQLHVNKGLNVIRFDKTQDAVINGAQVIDAGNSGRLGDATICGNYTFSHPAQTEIGYNGADATGISISFCKNLYVLDPKVVNLVSENGRARGVRIFNKCWRVKVSKGFYDQIRAGQNFADGVWTGTGFDQRNWQVLLNVPYCAALPNGIPKAIGIDVWDDCEGRLVEGCHDSFGHPAHKPECGCEKKEKDHKKKKDCCPDFDTRGTYKKDSYTVLLVGNTVGTLTAPVEIPYKTTNKTAQVP